MSEKMLFTLVKVSNDTTFRKETAVSKKIYTYTPMLIFRICVLEKQKYIRKQLFDFVIIQLYCCLNK